MGILSVHRDLLSNSKSQFKHLISTSSSNLRFIRRISSPPVHDPAGLSKAQSPHASTGDLKSNNNKLMFLIKYFYNRSVYSWSCPSGPYKYSVISAAENSWKDHHNICNPFISGLGKCELADWCNELMLLVSPGYDKISLWNSTINKIIKILPESDVQHYHPKTIILDYDTEAFGFGFDPETEDYKVLRFIVFNYADGSDSSLAFTNVELYSLKTNSWKKIIYRGAPPFQSPSVCVNGVYYWGDSLEALRTHVAILSFDFANEKFSHILLPPELDERFKGFYTFEFDWDLEDNYVLVKFDGSLAVLVHSGKKVKPFSFEVWGWNGESWHERVPRTTIDLPCDGGGGVEVVVIGLFQDDKLFLQNGVGQLMLFHLAKRKLECLGIIANPHYVRIFPYVGSSVLFHTMGNK